jgi:Radical SAM superfamily
VRAIESEPPLELQIGYLKKLPAAYTRGCHNRSGFCYLATEGLRMPYRMRDPGQIAAEFLADGQPYAVFIDNNLGSNRAYLRELCHALRPIKKIWSAAVSIDVTDDPDLIRTMALAGCTGVFVGFESLTDENLTAARKKTPKAGDYARRVRMLHDYGIQVNGSFVLGFDHDRKDVFARTATWIEENRLECATFHILTPYPATPLFRQMESEGRLFAQGLGALRYGARSISAQPHVARGTGRRVHLDVPAPVLTRFDLATPAPGLARCGTVSGDVVPVQALQPVLAVSHSAPPGACRVVAAGRTDPATASRFPPESVPRETLDGPGTILPAGL